ncbi:MAG: RNA 2'-phosphotransferase [Ruminococcus sp.]|nr:RNA 2'-phosphotransferase [Ruminococcus sp.]
MKEQNNLTKLSKFLSLILRHSPQTVGIEIEYQGGWTDVSTLIQKVNQNGKYHLDMQTLEEIVRTDEKQRYSFNADKTKIRANQGHSIPVNLELKEQIPPEILYHGTAERFLQSISEQGLLHMSRQYVHLSKDEETALKVGKRHGKPYILKVKAGEMHQQGYQFYLSENGVWLTEHVPPEFLIWNP